MLYYWVFFKQQFCKSTLFPYKKPFLCLHYESFVWKPSPKEVEKNRGWSIYIPGVLCYIHLRYVRFSYDIFLFLLYGVNQNASSIDWCPHGLAQLWLAKDVLKKWETENQQRANSFFFANVFRWAAYIQALYAFRTSTTSVPFNSFANPVVHYQTVLPAFFNQMDLPALLTNQMEPWCVVQKERGLSRAPCSLFALWWWS